MDSLLNLLNGSNLGDPIPSLDGKYFIIPLISHGNNFKGKYVDIISAFKSSNISGESFETISISKFKFRNSTSKTIIFPIGSVISGDNQVQDRVLSAPAICGPTSQMVFEEALCGNVRAKSTGPLEGSGVLLPISLKSGNPLIQPRGRIETPQHFERERSQDIRHVIGLSQQERQLETNIILKYFLQISNFFLRETNHDDKTRHFLEAQLHFLNTLMVTSNSDHERRDYRGHLYVREIDNNSNLLDLTPREISSNIETSRRGLYQENFRNHENCEREIFEVRRRFILENDQNIQSLLWQWIKNLPYNSASAYRIINQTNREVSLSENFLRPQENEVGMLIISSDQFALNFIPDSECWSNYRTHFLASYLNSPHTHHRNDSPNETVNQLNVEQVLALVEKLRNQISVSNNPSRTNRDGYDVSFFTDGFYKAWAIESEGIENEFQYVALHGKFKEP